MFGGNPGGKQGKEDRVRLGDFWRLHLLRPNRREVLRQCEVPQYHDQQPIPLHI